MITTMFNKLIGQEEVKRTLSFFAKAQNKNGIAPFLMMSGAKGLGKPEFAKEDASNLKNKDGSKRPFLEINCSTIKNANAFFEQIFLPIVMHNEITILLDEAHMLPKDLVKEEIEKIYKEKFKQIKPHCDIVDACKDDCSFDGDLDDRVLMGSRKKGEVRTYCLSISRIGSTGKTFHIDFKDGEC